MPQSSGSQLHTDNGANGKLLCVPKAQEKLPLFVFIAFRVKHFKVTCERELVSDSGVIPTADTAPALAVGRSSARCLQQLSIALIDNVGRKTEKIDFHSKCGLK